MCKISTESLKKLLKEWFPTYEIAEDYTTTYHPKITIKGNFECVGREFELLKNKFKNAGFISPNDIVVRSFCEKEEITVIHSGYYKKEPPKYDFWKTLERMSDEIDRKRKDENE